MKIYDSMRQINESRSDHNRILLELYIKSGTKQYNDGC